MKFQFRFATVLRLRENERDEARALVTEAHEALRQIEDQRQAIADERKRMLGDHDRFRAGIIKVERLLSEGRYERQLAADDAQLVEAETKIRAELDRRHAVLTQANAAVRQMELLLEQDLQAWRIHRERTDQSSLDELAARQSRSRFMANHDLARETGHSLVQSQEED